MFRRHCYILREPKGHHKTINSLQKSQKLKIHGDEFGKKGKIAGKRPLIFSIPAPPGPQNTFTHFTPLSTHHRCLIDVSGKWKLVRWEKNSTNWENSDTSFGATSFSSSGRRFRVLSFFPVFTVFQTKNRGLNDFSKRKSGFWIQIRIQRRILA